MKSSEYHRKVRQQYETYPYPARDPEEEKQRLSVTSFDSLGKINHYCFRGKRDFQNNFRVLIAGGGTGDATIYLAEQLRDTKAQVVYLDISKASMEVAQKRAAIRQLENIEWIKGSILDLPRLELPPFDYINCSGVLHHLKDPVAGLKALAKALHPEGAMGIMVYGAYGRTGVYQIQELMRLINTGEENPEIQVENTKTVIDCLPATNWFKRAEPLFAGWKDSDIETYDLFLHSQDRAYTVPQIYDWVEGCGLSLIAFCNDMLLYHPEYALNNQKLKEQIQKLSLRNRQAIAELAFGLAKMHSFFISRQRDTIAKPTSPDNIPFFMDDFPRQHFAEVARTQTAGSPLTLSFRTNQFSIRNSSLTASLLGEINGETTIDQLTTKIQDQGEIPPELHSKEKILKEFQALYELLNLMDCLFLRHSSVPPYPGLQEMQNRVTRMFS